MAWIESHQKLEKHPKVLHLQRLLGSDLDQTLGRLHRFWWWCLEYAENGDLTRFEPIDIGLSMGLVQKEAEQFVTSLTSSGWIDSNGDQLRKIHDWWDYVGRFLQSKYKNYPDKWMMVRERYLEPPKNGTKGQLPNLTKPNLTKPIESTPPADSQQKALEVPPMPVHPWLIGLPLYETDEKLKAKIWEVDKAWMKTYTATDIGQEIKAAHAWELSNYRKTNRIRFLNNWLNRSQDRGGSHGRRYVGAGSAGGTGQGAAVAGLASPVPGKYAASAKRDEETPRP